MLWGGLEGHSPSKMLSFCAALRALCARSAAQKRIGQLADPFSFPIPSKSSLRLVAVDLLEQARLLGRRLVLLVAAPCSLGLL